MKKHLPAFYLVLMQIFIAGSGRVYAGEPMRVVEMPTGDKMSLYDFEKTLKDIRTQIVFNRGNEVRYKYVLYNISDLLVANEKMPSMILTKNIDSGLKYGIIIGTVAGLLPGIYCGKQLSHEPDPQSFWRPVVLLTSCGLISGLISGAAFGTVKGLARSNKKNIYVKPEYYEGLKTVIAEYDSLVLDQQTKGEF